MDVYDAVKKRRTIRRFKQELISREILEKLVDAGRLAPTGGNMQPLEYIIVDEKDAVDSVFPFLKWAMHLGEEGPPPEGKRPVAYVIVLVNRDVKKAPVHDCGAAIENMLLLAVSEGLSGCWLGSIKRDELVRCFNIPYNYDIDSVVALGYPAEISLAEPFTGSVKYWKDEKGIMHVPKRSMKDIVHYNLWLKKK